MLMNSQEHNGWQGPEGRVVRILSSKNSPSDGAEEDSGDKSGQNRREDPGYHYGDR
jgi:hypothetical protein